MRKFKVYHEVYHGTRARRRSLKLWIYLAWATLADWYARPGIIQFILGNALGKHQCRLKLIDCAECQLDVVTTVTLWIIMAATAAMIVCARSNQ